ncbi:hypothetical protein GCM10023322_25300 [Rugosimonospora acidiphila]|uniref:Uncharacterized protein n=1 Tax=Rugosimonospora acidiphila TaxID=556531 RepID=A0ABP9RQ53_9ACTN
MIGVASIPPDRENCPDRGSTGHVRSNWLAVEPVFMGGMEETFSPDGRTVAGGGADHTVHLDDLAQLDDLRGNARVESCPRAGRGLDPGEWAREVPGLPYQRTRP